MANSIVGTVELNVNPLGVGVNRVGRPSKEVSESEIRRLYCDEQLSLAEVAAELGVASLTIRARMTEYGIPARGRGRPLKGATNTIGELTLDPDKGESKAAQKALDALLAAEAAEVEAEATPEAEPVEEVTESETTEVETTEA